MRRPEHYFAFILTVCCALPAIAASYYNPNHIWKTIETPHFFIHFYEGERNLALRVGRIAEEVLDDLRELLDFEAAGKIDIVLSDNSDRANGSAQVFPKNIIRLYLSAPTELTGLSSYHDWIKILLIHELAHIHDLDQTRGFTRFLRWIFGRTVAYNSYTPQYLSEGVAVYAETILTPTGRGRSSYVEMILRMAALENRWVNIDQAHLGYSEWPGAATAYFYGGRFHLWLAQTYGREKVAQLHALNASLPLPYLYWVSAKLTFGKSLPELWDAWHEHERTYALAVESVVKKQGLSPNTRITKHGRNIGGIRYSPNNNEIIYSRSSPVDGATVRLIERASGKDKVLVRQTYSPRISFSKDGNTFFYSQNAINERFNDFSDIHRYDLKEEKSEKLTHIKDPEKSLRARDPDLAPDEQSILFVQNQLHQNRLTLGLFAHEDKTKLTLKTLLPARQDIQYACPRFSPDGQHIVVALWQTGGQQGLLLIDAKSGKLARHIGFLDAQHGNPTWSADGQEIIFESDKNGISNLYGYNLKNKTYSQVTNVVGGAFQPDVAPDGRTILFRQASSIGFDIYEMPYEPASWRKITHDEETEKTQTKTLNTLLEIFSKQNNERINEKPLALKSHESESDYAAWRSILPFQHNWLLIPHVFLQNNDPSASLSTLGQDVLGRHTYLLNAGSSQYAENINWSAKYINDVWYPTLAMGMGQKTFTLNQGEVRERANNFSLAGSLPLGQRHFLSLNYTLEAREDLSDVANADYDLGGDFSYVQFAYHYNFSRHYPYSVSPEHGRSLGFAIRHYSSALGGDFNEWLFTGNARVYLNNPLFHNHVFALRLTGAFALGPDYKEIFYLGGEQGASIFSIQTARVYPLRGFAQNSESGTGMFGSYAEYRFPLWHIERGIWTLPVYFERIHMAFFCDAANTFGNGSEKDITAMFDKMLGRLQGIQASTGAEVRMNLTLGWQVPLTLRLGVALPFARKGKVIDEPALQTYFNLGTSF